MINNNQNPSDQFIGAWSSTTVDVQLGLTLKVILRGRIKGPVSQGYKFKSKSHKRSFGLSKELFIPMNYRGYDESVQILRFSEGVLKSHANDYNDLCKRKKFKGSFALYLDKMFSGICADLKGLRFEVYQS